MNEWGSQNYFGNYALSSFYRWDAPISDALLLSSKFTLFPYLVILGLDSINISLLPDGSVLVSSIEGHCKAIAEGGAFHSGLGCVMPSKGDSDGRGIWKTPWCSFSREYLCHSAGSFLRISSGPATFPTKFLNQLGCSPRPAPPYTLWKDDWPPAGYKLMRQSIHFQGGLGVGRDLLQALRASILYSPSALEKSSFLQSLFPYCLETSFTPLVVNHS